MKKTIFVITIFLAILSCKNNSEVKTDSSSNEEKSVKYPSDVLPFLNEWKILLGDGTYIDSLENYQKEGFFYVDNEDEIDWVVYKTPNSGITSRTSSNTRTELGQKKHLIPEVGGKLTGTLKVKHVSTTGDANIASSFSVVIGQIHSDEGHENEPLKIYYKKFPDHKKGAVFWNYEINTKGDNAGRWDFSTKVWGYDFAYLGENATTYPAEPEDGIELGEEFSYEVNIYKGIMYLTFTSKNHETIKFTKSLIKSDFATKKDIPQQVIKRYASKKVPGVEQENAYKNENCYFKQGAYNQANFKSTKSEIYGGDIQKQYANGSYTEVWFKKGTLNT